MLPPTFAWASGMAGRALGAAKPWLMGGGALMGAGALAGMVNPDRGAISGAAQPIRGAFAGAFTGGLLGAAGGAGYAGAVGYGGMGLGRRLAANIGGAALRWGRMGALGGAALGAAFGLMKAGVTSNRPVNRIRGLHQ